MYNRVIHVPAPARVLAALVLLLLAGCTAEKSAPTVERIVEVVTATPVADYAAVQPEPTITLHDPNARAREAANNAAFVAETSTAEARNAMATQIAYERAQAEATSAALSLTQQVEEYNAGATAYANSAAATATTQALALDRQETDATATARAEAVQDTHATQEATEAQERALEHQRRKREAEQDALDEQVRFILGLIAAVLVIVLGGFAGWQVVKLLATILGIEARRRLIDYRAGVYIDAQTGRPEALPGYTPAPALAAPGDEPTRAERLRAAIKPDALDAAFQASERQVRQTWKMTAWQFLRWSEHIPRGEDTPVGFSRRRLCAAARITRDAYHVMIGFLTDLSLIEKETDHPRSSWVLARGSDGQPMTVSQALRHTVWLTSFDTPDVPALPEIPHPPERSAQGQTTPDHPDQTTPDHSGPRQTTKTGENGIIEGQARPVTGWNLSLDYGPDDLPDDGEDVAEAS